MKQLRPISQATGRRRVMSCAEAGSTSRVRPNRLDNPTRMIAPQQRCETIGRFEWRMKGASKSCYGQDPTHISGMPNGGRAPYKPHLWRKRYSPGADRHVAGFIQDRYIQPMIR